MARSFENLHEAWTFLKDHPMVMDQDGLDHFADLFDIDVVMVDPATKTVEDDPQRNTEVRVWLEFGPWHKPESLSDAEREAMPDGCAGHDIDLDCGATTFEQAVMILAQKVFERYGDY